MSESNHCPACQSPFGYPTGTSMMCPECGHEWNPEENTETAHADTDVLIVKDANGNVLQDGDTVVLIKDLPVKGAPKPIKAGTKVKNIRLTDGDQYYNEGVVIWLSGPLILSLHQTSQTINSD